MPRISAFYGIVIWMYHDEVQHLGRPHFHATYGEHEASIAYDSLAVLAGHLPPRARPSRRARCQLGTGAPPSSIAANRAIAMTRLPSVPMRSTPQLIEATPIAGWVVRLRFEDGMAGDVDLGYLLDYGGVFEPLRDPAFFRELRADADAGTIVWPNDADVAPETLYAKLANAAARVH